MRHHALLPDGVDQVPVEPDGRLEVALVDRSEDPRADLVDLSATGVRGCQFGGGGAAEVAGALEAPLRFEAGAAVRGGEVVCRVC